MQRTEYMYVTTDSCLPSSGNKKTNSKLLFNVKNKNNNLFVLCNFKHEN